MEDRHNNPEYINTIVALITPIVNEEYSVFDIAYIELERIGAEYGTDSISVLQDCMDAIDEIRIETEIRNGHDYHVETQTPTSIDELIGCGMITEDTYILTVDQFIEKVRASCLMDYDGYGEFVSGDGEEFYPVRCNVEWLEEFRDDWPYVAWFNK